MDLDEQMRRIDRLIEYIENELPKFAEQVLATDLVALITNRVVQRGETFEGGKFKPYSSNTVAAWRFWGKSRNQAAEKRVRTISRARGALSYKEFRELNRLKTDTKNFEFTGEMWRKFGVVRSSKSGKEFTVSIGGTNSASQTKIDENTEREGINIIEASKKEEQLAQRTTRGWLERNADRILNG